MNQNATREQIARALRTGASDSAIARELRADRHRVTAIRQSNGYPRTPRQPFTLNEKWQHYTRPAMGGHLEWTGERQSTSGSPVLRYREHSVSPAAVAFRIRHGREPVGYVMADCGLHHCIAPDHVEDELLRTATRETLRLITGRTPRSERCVHGHDQTMHGRYETDGRSYCRRCKAERKTPTRAAR